jgi:hypothetical protein
MFPAATLPSRTRQEYPDGRGQPPGADGRTQFRHRPLPERGSEHADEQPAERQQVQMLDSPWVTPFEQAEHEAGRGRHGDQQWVQRERTADHRQDEPATAFRREPVTDRHQRRQQPQPGDERAHQQTEDHPFARSHISAHRSDL